MSEMELHRGAAVLVQKQGDETLEDVCKRICENECLKLDKSYSSYEELLKDEYYGKYITANDDLYELIDFKLGNDSSIYNFNKNDDGSISYLVQFYNGGASFMEVTENDISRITEGECEK